MYVLVQFSLLAECVTHAVKKQVTRKPVRSAQKLREIFLGKYFSSQNKQSQHSVRVVLPHELQQYVSAHWRSRCRSSGRPAAGFDY